MTARFLSRRLDQAETQLAAQRPSEDKSRAQDREALLESLPCNVLGTLLYALTQAHAAGREGDYLPELPDSLVTLLRAAEEQGRWPEGVTWEFCTRDEWDALRVWLKQHQRGLDARGVEVVLSGRSMSVLNLVFALEHGPDSSATYEAFLVARQMREQHADLPEDAKRPVVPPPAPKAGGAFPEGSPPPSLTPVPSRPVEVRLDLPRHRGPYRYSARDDLLDGVVPEKRWRWPH
jgi:hypothetical protein